MTTELTPNIADELIHRGFETPDLDYKLEFDDSTGAWMELAKDVYGMSNNGGGFIVIGVEDGSFVPVGVDTAFQKDVQDWIDRISKWATGGISLAYVEYVAQVNGNLRKFPIIHVHGSIGSLVIPKTDGTYTDAHGVTKTAFKQSLIYTRRETKTVPANGDEFWLLFWALLKRTAEKLGGQGTPLEVVSVLSRKAEPDLVEEALWFNLFPVSELPDVIHVAETDYRFPLEIYDFINAQYSSDRRVYIPSFMLLDKKLYTFSPFDKNNPLSMCVKGSVSTVQTKEWFLDPAYQQKLVMLLNYCLKDLCRRRGFFYDRKRDRFFMRYFGGPVPEITWKPYKRTSTRQLVWLRVNNQGRLSYCEHFGGRLRFMILGDGIYLVVEPIRVLTEDGEFPLDQRRNVRISTKKSFFYHNNNYLYETKLWLHILAGTRTEILLGDDKGQIKVSVSPINAQASFGIVDDQYTSEDFLDALKSEPFEYTISYEDSEEDNPLTDTSLEE